MPTDDTNEHMVQYLLVVQGNSMLVDEFIARVQHASQPDQLFVPSLAAPIPHGLKDVDISSIPLYLLIERKYGEAADVLEETGGDQELVAILRDETRHSELTGYIQRARDPQAMQGVKQARANVRTFNVLTRAQWAAKNRGLLGDELRCSVRQRELDERVTYQFSAHVLDLTLVETLARQNPQLAFGMVAVDADAEKQAYAWHCRQETRFEQQYQDIDATQPTWLELLPEPFC